VPYTQQQQQPQPGQQQPQSGEHPPPPPHLMAAPQLQLPSLPCGDQRATPMQRSGFVPYAQQQQLPAPLPLGGTFEGHYQRGYYDPPTRGACDWTVGTGREPAANQWRAPSPPQHAPPPHLTGPFPATARHTYPIPSAASRQRSL
jgi:hypothetical protein